MPIRVSIVDDKASNRNIIRDKLLRSGHFIIVTISASGEDFLDRMRTLSKEEMPDVVLMDIEMPGMDGVKTIALGSTLYPQVRFVVLTIFDDEEKIFNAIQAGAFGYLLKEDSGMKISDTLWQMHETGIGPISPGIAHKILQLVQANRPGSPAPKVSANLFDLTERERQILQLLKDGLQYKEIGSQLGISTNTAKKHVVNIYEKLHVDCRAQALQLIYAKGLL